MTAYVLDTSVAVAWYLPEDFSVEARKWQQDFLDGRVRLLVPLLHYLELGNVLRTYVRRRELDEKVARDIYALHQEAPLQVMAPDLASLLDIALDYEATVYDAAFISLSLNHQAPLLTAERTTTPWVVKLGPLAHSVRKNM